MMNFALDTIGTTVASDKVCTDGYEASNLISPEFFLRRKGCMAEHFIRPPVNVTFVFPCHVNIHQVTLEPTVGQQQSLQFEIYAASIPIPKNLREATTTVQMSEAAVLESSPSFYCLAKMTVSNSSTICFYNQKSSSSYLQNSNRNVREPEHFEYRTILFHPKRELLTSCSHLSVRIIRTKSGSTACLKNINIWGVPSYSLSNMVRTEIENRYHKRPSTSETPVSQGLKRISSVLPSTNCRSY